MAHAWHTARLTAYAPAKGRDFIKLDKMLVEPNHAQQRTRQSPEQQLEVMKAFMAGRRR